MLIYGFFVAGKNGRLMIGDPGKNRRQGVLEMSVNGWKKDDSIRWENSVLVGVEHA